MISLSSAPVEALSNVAHPVLVMSPFEQGPNEETPSNDRVWYDKARAKAEGFLGSIDPELRVEVVPIRVTERSSQRETLSLRFYSSSNPTLNWTMEVETTDSYIENELEPVVRQIYHERRQKRR